MAETEPLGYSSNIIDTHKLRRPSRMMLLPAIFFPTIGHVVTAWGYFEALFDAFLESLLAASGTPARGWERQPFKKRRGLVRERSSAVFDGFPALIAYLDTLCSDAANLYLDRNLVAHGRLMSSIGKTEKACRLRCSGTHNGKPIQREYTWDQLDDLYYAIVHLTGRLSVVMHDDSDHGLPSPDRQQLQAFLRTNPPNDPNYPKHRHQPTPSQK